MLNYTKTGACN